MSRAILVLLVTLSVIAVKTSDDSYQCLLTALESPEFFESFEKLLKRYNYAQNSTIYQALLTNLGLIKEDINCDVNETVKTVESLITHITGILPQLLSTPPK